MEIVIAIALLAICITPALQSFITSAIVNKNSRALMYATELGETVNESIADKSYDVIRMCVGIDGSSGIQSQDLVGRLQFFSISDNFYNKKDNAIMLDSDACLANIVSVNKCDIQYKFATSPETVSNGNIISGNNAYNFSQATLNQVFYGSIVKQKAPKHTAGVSNNNTYCWHDESGLMSCISFTDVHYGPYTFDVVVSFLPTCEPDSHITNDADYKYFSYSVCTSVYQIKGAGVEVEPTDALGDALLDRTDSSFLPTAVLYTGIKSK